MLRLVMPSIGTSLGVSYPTPVLVIDWTSLGVALVAIVLATLARARARDPYADAIVRDRRAAR